MQAILHQQEFSQFFPTPHQSSLRPDIRIQPPNHRILNPRENIRGGFLMPSPEKLPPASIEAEEALLGAILFDPKVIGKLSDWLPVNAFYVGSHQAIYSAALKLFSENRPTDLITISTYLDNHGNLEYVGGMAKLSQLLNRTVSASSFDGYARLIFEKYKLRELIAIGYQIAELGFDQTRDLEDVYAEIKSLLPSEITGASQGEKSLKIKMVRYSLYNKFKTKKLEMEAEINEEGNLLDATSKLAAKVEETAEELWREEDQ